MENGSDVQPDTIHADTQGQGAAIFGIAHLLGIQFQPRIRNWKGLHYFRSRPELCYGHIDLFFSKTIDWNLIEAMLPEMLRVAISIGAGRIKPSTILRRLATYSRKSKLYFAFRELGHAVRSGFLLNCLSGIELRHLIQAATNKRGRFNQFLQSVSFSGGALAAEDVRDEHRKFIKYNHLLANLLIFHYVETMSKALERLIAEGSAVDLDLIACSSPYVTGHLNRFGRYELSQERMQGPLESIREFRMPPRGETNSRPAQAAV